MYQVGELVSNDQAMRLAIEIAKQGRGFVSPNPVVGCVILDRDSRFLASGAHLKFGEAHAEKNALSRVSDPETLVGASLFVTLEPCAHQGKTGSCAEAILKTSIEKIYFGAFDPNPQVSGRGVEILEKAGKKVSKFEGYARECEELAEQFHFHMSHQRPFVSLKVGSSLDGKMALNSGESQWITGEESRRLARQMRGYYDATMVGAGTLEFDDPKLDFRETIFEGKKQNKIVILDPKGKAAAGFKERNLFKIHGAKNIFVLTRSEHVPSWTKNLVNVVPWDSSEQGWEQALKNLYQKGICSIYVEGGSFVFGQMLRFQLAQKIYTFQSNKIIGQGVSWSQYFEIQKLDQSLLLRTVRSTNVGDERLLYGYF